MSASSSAAGSQKAPLVRLRGIGKIFDQTAQHTEALRDVSFDVEEGSFVSFVGPSGCGKTTLLKICAGLIGATSGQLQYRGTQQPIPPRDMGMVFQTAALMPWRTVLANVMYPADILRLDRKKARERASALLELVGLAGTEARYPHELSGGMQQRVSIARALLHDPAVLFMDEPFGALDALTREDMGFELQRIHGEAGKTILFVTHSIPEAVLLSDRIVVLGTKPGRVLKVFEVKQQRPRSLANLGLQEMQELSLEIRALLGDNERRAMGLLGD